ncbi:MAG: S9 family peptidase [Chlamydiales bacterium]|nr:S9 family peptidase [Chlamydiia bacterium]MCP5507544.1 S9 family peptidase [Chlamydiales bacterium]
MHKLTILLSFFFSSLHALTPEQMMQYRTIAEFDIDPGGQEILYTVSTALMNENESRYVRQIWTKTHPLTDHPSGSYSPQWSPDGKQIAFLSKRNDKANIFLMGAHGGEPRQLTEAPEDIQTIRWSPDGTMIAFTMKKPLSEENIEKIKQKMDMTVADSDEQPTQLYLVFVDSGEQKLLSADDQYVLSGGDFETNDLFFDWSPDSKAVAYTYAPESGFDSRYQDCRIATVDIATGEIAKIAMVEGCQSKPHYSPDGKTIAFLLSDPKKSYAFIRQLATIPVEGGEVTKLAATEEEGPFLTGPSFLGWDRNGQKLYLFEPYKTRYALWSIPIDGSSPIRFDDGAMLIGSPVLSSNRRYLAFTLQDSSTPAELYLSSASRYNPKKITDHNKHMPKNLPKTEVVSWENEGLTIEGLLTYPRNYEEGKKYPLLLIIHGGPMAFFDESYVGRISNYPIATFAEENYAVLRPNPRGSCGYGRAFRCANYEDWGGGDYRDLMAGIDKVIAMGIADPDALGVMGGSYGGYMTAWIITQTDRFKAASLWAPVTNQISIAGTMDLHRFNYDYFGGYHWEKPDLYRDRSPITHVANINTPALIQHGQDDTRVPLAQGMEFYRALKNRDIPTKLEIYPRTGHHIHEPKLQLIEMNSNLQWFKYYLPTTASASLQDRVKTIQVRHH